MSEQEPLEGHSNLPDSVVIGMVRSLLEGQPPTDEEILAAFAYLLKQEAEKAEISKGGPKPKTLKKVWKLLTKGTNRIIRLNELATLFSNTNTPRKKASHAISETNQLLKEAGFNLEFRSEIIYYLVKTLPEDEK